MRRKPIYSIEDEADDDGCHRQIDVYEDLNGSICIRYSSNKGDFHNLAVTKEQADEIATALLKILEGL